MNLHVRTNMKRPIYHENAHFSGTFVHYHRNRFLTCRSSSYCRSVQWNQMVKWPFFGELNVSTFKSRQPLYPQWFGPWSRLAISAPILSKDKKFSSETFAQFHIFYPYSPTPLCFCLVMRYFLETSGAGWHVSRKLDQKITPQMSLFVPIAAPGFILVHASLVWTKPKHCT